MLLEFCSAWLFSLALCADAFVASIAYGADDVCINWKQMGLMNAISSACLGAALSFGTLLRVLGSGCGCPPGRFCQPFSARLYPSFGFPD